MATSLYQTTREWQIQENGKSTKSYNKSGSLNKFRVPPSEWRWPDKPTYILADPHADSDAFIDSLVTSGRFIRDPDTQDGFRPITSLQDSLYIMAGDFLDKGPDNLQLLDKYLALKTWAPQTQFLLGNHDVRLYIALKAIADIKNYRIAHFFVRMGGKGLALLQNIYSRDLKGGHALKDIPSNKACKKKLWPHKHWFDEFPKLAAELSLPEAEIKREIKRLKKKMAEFEQNLEKLELDYQRLYASAVRCHELFLHPQGQYAWFFRDQQFLLRLGSFLFMHAGVDDTIASRIASTGINSLNRQFISLLKHSPFNFYYGAPGNMLRTKYRSHDRAFTEKGGKALSHAGIQAIVHGHLRNTGGQRLTMRSGILHVETDIALDRNSRKECGLSGHGWGITMLSPEKMIIGISQQATKVCTLGKL